MKIHYKKDTFEIWGYYPGDYEDVPTPNLEVLDDVYAKAIKINATHINPNTKEPYKIEPTQSETSIDELKQIKLNELNDWFEAMKNHSKINLNGFGVIDGGYKYLLNVRAIKNNFELLPEKLFRMWDNSFKEVSLQDINKIEKAIELAGIQLHSIKWSYEEVIANANSQDELEAINFSDTVNVELDNE